MYLTDIVYKNNTVDILFITVDSSKEFGDSLTVRVDGIQLPPYDVISIDGNDFKIHDLADYLEKNKSDIQNLCSWNFTDIDDIIYFRKYVVMKPTGMLLNFRECIVMYKDKEITVGKDVITCSDVCDLGITHSVESVEYLFDIFIRASMRGTDTIIFDSRDGIVTVKLIDKKRFSILAAKMRFICI